MSGLDHTLTHSFKDADGPDFGFACGGFAAQGRKVGHGCNQKERDLDFQFFIDALRWHSKMSHFRA
jgi:hypothetical protein